MLEFSEELEKICFEFCVLGLTISAISRPNLTNAFTISKAQFFCNTIANYEKVVLLQKDPTNFFSLKTTKKCYNNNNNQQETSVELYCCFKLWKLYQQ